jgi:tetratricopeptide (TPR) repeat protein
MCTALVDEYAEAQQRYEEALLVYRTAGDSRGEANTLNSLGVACVRSPTGDRRANLEKAIECYQQALRFFTPESAPQDFAQTQNNLGLALSYAGRFAEARQAFLDLLKVNPENATAFASLSAVCRKLGLAEEAGNAIREAQRLSAGEHEYNRACIAAIAGDADAAFELLAAALAAGEVNVEWVREDSDWEELRGDPRFVKLVGNQEKRE